MTPSYLWRRGGRVIGLMIGLVIGGWGKPSGSQEPAPTEKVPAKGVPADKVHESAITAVDREHWSFHSLICPPIPVLDDASWCRTPIDCFVLRRMREKGLRPAAEADRPSILRRLSFDLTGLPPTPAQLAAFLADGRPDSYLRLVDRLLGSPAYGERWGQHWLELARFAETDGFEHDKLRPSAWQYRDWVINALNDDLPYDQFVTLQLAGDEVAPGDDAARFATGFCLSGPDMPDINSQEERRHTLLNEMTGAVSAVFLGLQMGCAQCHDHKYDPISQGDFYRLRAFFEPAIRLEKDKSVTFLEVRDKKTPTSHLFLRGDWRRPGPDVQPAFPRIANPWDDALPAETRDSSMGRRTALAKWLLRADHPLTTRVLANRLWQHHFGSGLSRTPSDFGLLGDEPQHLELLDWLACEIARCGWSLKAVHRIIVTSATYRQSSSIADIGIRIGDSNPQSAIRNLKLNDPENRDLARFERRRLTGEELRDAMWQSSASLESARGGPGVMPPLPEELSQTLLKNQWTESRRQADHYRRSIYVFARRNLRYPIFDVFDRPDANSSCPARNRSTTAPQSLHLLNSEMSLDAARRLAGIVLSEEHDTDRQIRRAVLRALSREPTVTERSQLAQFLEQQRSLLQRESRSSESLALPIPFPEGAPPYQGAAFVDLCLALFNLNEFVYLD